jgi:hypothetical protein
MTVDLSKLEQTVGYYCGIGGFHVPSGLIDQASVSVKTVAREQRTCSGRWPAEWRLQALVPNRPLQCNTPAA